MVIPLAARLQWMDPYGAVLIAPSIGLEGIFDFEFIGNLARLLVLRR
jgi:hypothetical protein